jgi:hypothetical protein
MGGRNTIQIPHEWMITRAPPTLMETAIVGKPHAAYTALRDCNGSKLSRGKAVQLKPSNSSVLRPMQDISLLTYYALNETRLSNKGHIKHKAKGALGA